MALRLLHVLDHSLPLHSGYTFRTLAILQEQRRLGWRTFHLTGSKQDANGSLEQTIDGWHFYRTPPASPRLAVAPPLLQWQAMRQLERRLDEVMNAVEPQLLHVHSPVLNALPALKVGRRRGVPVVYEVRAFWEDAAVDHGTTREGSPRYRLTRHLETVALRHADHVFTICNGLRDDILGRGIAPGKVTVIPNAVAIEDFGPSRPADRALLEELGLTGRRVIGFIGSFYAYEGLDLLLEALPGIAADVPEVAVLLVGGGPQEAALKAQAKRLGIAERLVFAGRVPHERVQEYYDCVDVLAYPRHSMRLTELVTPLKPLEALARSQVVVASDVGGHRELINDHETGLLFRAGDAASLRRTVVEALTDRPRRLQLGRAGRRFVEDERTWRASVERYAGVFRALLPGTDHTGQELPTLRQRSRSA